ncbi:MAG: hypothetical protein HYU02_04045 [Thaumarchaeota archaeon]|nr:hypothetical protein [Nitrososphaerota archaeon]
MADSPQEASYVSCPLGHRGVRGIAQCARCNLPIIPYGKDLAESIERFASLSKEFAKPKHLFPIGLGLWGSKLLFTTLNARDYRSVNFGIIGASNADLQSFTSSITQRASKEEAERILRRVNHPIKFTVDKMGGLWGQAEGVVKKDAALADRIGVIGLHDTEEEQVAMLAGALGEGLVAGVAPHLASIVKEQSPSSSRIFFGTLPSEDNPEQMLFNAYCGLARLVKSNIDAAIIMQDTGLSNLKGILRSGNEIGSDNLLPIMLDIMLGDDIDNIQEFARLSRSFRIQVYSPIFAFGRSYEIYEGLPNILEHATYNPISTFSVDSVVLSAASIRVPAGVLERVGRDSLEEQFNAWSKKKFPLLRGTSLRILTKDEPSDRLDVLLLLGGTKLDAILQPVKAGYKDFKSHIESMDLWEEYNIAKEELNEIDDMISKYDRRLAQLLRKK